MPLWLGSRVHPSAVASMLVLTVLVALGSVMRFVDDPLLRSNATSSPTGSVTRSASSRFAARAVTAAGTSIAGARIATILGAGGSVTPDPAVRLPLLDRSVFVPPRG